MVKIINMEENYANQPQSVIVMNYLCKNMVETKRNVVLVCSCFETLPQACARGQRNSHHNNYFDWSRNNGNDTRANYCP